MDIEIHPDTPAQGVLLTEKFKGMNLSDSRENLRRAGAPYGIEFGAYTLLANSRLAIEASEFAKDQGQFPAFHEKVFYTTFTEARNIGDINVLLDIAQEVGLNRDELREALETGRYRERLEQAQEEAMRYGVSGTPTFIINDKYRVVGAQPLEAFRNALLQIQQEEQGQA